MWLIHGTPMILKRPTGILKKDAENGWKGFYMIKQNLHTHSTYCDGKDRIEEIVQTAIEKDLLYLVFPDMVPV